MTRARARGAFGLVLGLVLLMLTLLGVGLVAQGSLSSGVADQVERDLRGEEAAVLAESALEEALARIALDANGGADGRLRGPIFSLFRGASNPAWDPQLGFEVPLAAKDLPAFQKLCEKRPLHRKPAPEVTARVRFQRFLVASGFQEHDERFGTLELTATIGMPGGRRRVTRWHEFRVVKPALPVPFDRTPLHVFDPEAYVNVNARVDARGFDDANALMGDSARSLQGALDQVRDVLVELDTVRDEISGAPGAGDVLRQIERVRAAFAQTRTVLDGIRSELGDDLARAASGLTSSRPLRQFGWPFVLYLYNPERSAPQMALGDLNVPRTNRELSDRKRRADTERKARADAWNRELVARSTNIEGPGTALAAAMADCAQVHRDVLAGYRDFQRGHFEQGGDAKLKTWREYRATLDETWFKPLDAPQGPAGVAIAGSRASFLVGPGASSDELARELHAVLDRYGPAFTGGIFVDNAGGPELVLDGARPLTQRWKSYSGRLVLAVGGHCTLRQVTRADARADLLAVVVYGDVTLGGPLVDASVVARGAVKRMTGPAHDLTLTGNLLIDGPAFARTDPAPESVFEKLTLVRDDTAVTNDPATGNRPAHSVVLFGPLAVYTNAPRQVAK